MVYDVVPNLEMIPSSMLQIRIKASTLVGGCSEGLFRYWPLIILFSNSFGISLSYKPMEVFQILRLVLVTIDENRDNFIYVIGSFQRHHTPYMGIHYYFLFYWYFFPLGQKTNHLIFWRHKILTTYDLKQNCGYYQKKQFGGVSDKGKTHLFDEINIM